MDPQNEGEVKAQAEGSFYKQAAPLGGAENSGIDIEGRANADTRQIEITLRAHGGTLPSMWVQTKLGDEPKRIYQKGNDWVTADGKNIPKNATNQAFLLSFLVDSFVLK